MKILVHDGRLTSEPEIKAPVKKFALKNHLNRSGAPLYRHCSLGVLPSSISIGSGLLPDDVFFQDLMLRKDSRTKSFRLQTSNGSGTISKHQKINNHKNNLKICNICFEIR